ncbi:uncharacterized protein LOC127372144 [Dicentrarchus labrax]|uniref:uncharacterized protein LOC127372144 n=1 Tax=Dicentrarchus labrax TaxID=13489 RepID=UPI0021F5F7EB|nr:uncharacterized protein LOC127372144 [Dicentrarchus labrax]XP_051271543.1 uncharacterized protein LOC127372144 [Dicentrarchus labrax]
MSTTKHQNFRSFLTERFTAVAVEIFGEVESIVEAFYEENKRLRNTLHMVLSPEIKLPRIDVSRHTAVTTDVRKQPAEFNAGVSQETSEPLPKIPKQEQTEYDINLGSEQQQSLGEADNVITTVCVKNEPKEEEEEDFSTDSYHIQVVEWNPDSPATVSADEVHDQGSEESSNENQEHPKHYRKATKKKKSKGCLQKTLLELPRMVPYKSLISTPTDYQSFLARLTEAFKDVPEDEKPLITKMGLTADMELVDCAFGKVPKGSPLSYQYPLPSSQDYMTNDNAPPRPLLPLSYHTLEPVLALPTLSAREQEHVDVMQITWEEAHSLEQSTRGGKEPVEELQKPRLTSRFREICTLKPGRSHAEHLVYKLHKGPPRCKSAQIEEAMKNEALRVYCRNLCVNWYPCGFIVHPHAPWLGVQPDGLVYDPNEKKSSFGLVHVKCISSQSFVDCGFLVVQDGVLEVKKNHTNYWQIQVEMMVAGTSWCDLLVLSREDILVQRIYRDKVISNSMKKKLDEFFFYYYLPSLF